MRRPIIRPELRRISTDHIVASFEDQRNDSRHGRPCSSAAFTEHPLKCSRWETSRARSDYDQLAALRQLTEGSIVARAQSDHATVPTVRRFSWGHVEVRGDDHLARDEAPVVPLNHEMSTFIGR